VGASLLQQGDDHLRNRARIEVGVGRERQEDLELLARLLVPVEHRQRRTAVERQPRAQRRAQSLVLLTLARLLDSGERVERARVVGHSELFLGRLEEARKIGGGGQGERGEKQNQRGGKKSSTHGNLRGHAGFYASRNSGAQLR